MMMEITSNKVWGGNNTKLCKKSKILENNFNENQ
jgi:hypothetical protein